jgi:predicted transcriptional regulator
MPAEDTALFLSLRPHYADLLLEGRKSIELRRVRPVAAEGSVVLLYAASPAMTLVGKAEVSQIHVAGLNEIWQQHGSETGITRKEYDRYFAGVDRAVAIELREIRRLERPRPLEDLRRRLAGFRPPQSYRYLDSCEVAALI